jgi:hypothetical protein
MWESKDQTLDINYNVAELWFIGVHGVPVPKPLDIKKMGGGKVLPSPRQEHPAPEGRPDASGPLAHRAQACPERRAPTHHPQA